jgi:nucleotide-binding universal stress UspA family protein
MAKADLIAISAHGRTGLIGRMLGSVAERIVHHAKIPVLMVHP